MTVKIAGSVNNAHRTRWFISSKYPVDVQWFKAKLQEFMSISNGEK